MKKHLLIVIAICVLLLSACGSLVGTSTPSSNSASHSTPITTASAQSVCQVLHDRQAQLSQQYHAASVQLASAQAGRITQQVGAAEKTLIRLHQSTVQVQTQLKAC
jgi:ABC-type molybdate transport system substrate-binding protein